MAAKKVKSERGNLLTYKGKILLRKGNKIYFGNPEDKFIILMVVEKNEKINGIDISTKVSITLMKNYESGRMEPVKKAEREGLATAMEIASLWLFDALEEETSK